MSDSSEQNRDSLGPADQSPTKQGEYIVVARRYRPQLFEELIGQEHVAKALTGAIGSDRVGHAYLFTGARGVGKTSAARIFAKALNCVEGPTDKPCNKCDICLNVSEGSDMDVLEIDGASNNTVDEIRQLRQNVSVRPTRARFKIYIIDEVHMLSRQAFNALLKTLEEPPQHVKFIFCTTEPEKIPITIHSRCQRYDFAGIQSQSIMGRLKQICETEGVTAEDEALEIIARRANGSMRDSQSLLEQLLSVGDKQLSTEQVYSQLGIAGSQCITTIVAAIVEKDARQALLTLDEAINSGVDVGLLVEQLLGHFRDCMVVAVGCGSDSFLHTSTNAAESVETTCQQLGLETILAVIQIFEQSLARMRISTQNRILAEMAIVRICNLENLDQISSLLQQLKNGQPLSISPQTTPPARNLPTSNPAKSAAKPISEPPRAKKKTLEIVADSPETNCPEIETPPNKAKESAAIHPKEGHVEPEPPQAINPPTIAFTAENATKIWEKALSSISDLVADQAALYESVAIFVPNRLVVYFPQKYTSIRDNCMRTDSLAKLQRAVAQLVGPQVRLSMELAVQQSDESPADLSSKGPSDNEETSNRQQMMDISKNQFVRAAIETFDANVVRLDDTNSTDQ